mgnify:CR=1 FL=1
MGGLWGAPPPIKNFLGWQAYQIGGKAGIFNIKVVYFIAFLENRSRVIPKEVKITNLCPGLHKSM